MGFFDSVVDFSEDVPYLEDVTASGISPFLVGYGDDDEDEGGFVPTYKPPKLGNDRIDTDLGRFKLPGDISRLRGAGSIDSLISSRTPLGVNLLRQGADFAEDTSRQGFREARGLLRGFNRSGATNEQNALLGLLGQEKQESAINNIPVSQFDQELQRRQRETLARGAAASGDLGSGFALQQAQQLGGAQRFETLQNRLSQLEPLAATNRSVSSTLAGMEEARGARSAQISTGLGTQLANIRLGAAAPLIQANMQQANLSGLQGIAQANQRGQIGTQLAGLAGQFFTPSTPKTVQTTQPQTVQPTQPTASAGRITPGGY